MSFTFQVEAGKTLRLPTALKVCPQDILITGVDGTGILQYSTSATFPNLNLFGKKEIQIYMPYLRNAQEMFVPANEANNTVEHITLIGGDTPTLLYCNAMFNMNWKGGPLKHITFDIDFSKVTYVSNLFNNHSGVVTIDGRPLDFSSIVEDLSFSYMSRLEHIRFAPGTMKRNLSMQSCEKLSDGSIQSVIESLQDLTGQATKNLTFHQSVGDKLTPAQKATITAKNWTLVY